MKIDIGYNSEKLIQIKIEKNIHHLKKRFLFSVNVFLSFCSKWDFNDHFDTKFIMPLIIEHYSCKLHNRDSYVLYCYIIIYFL